MGFVSGVVREGEEIRVAGSNFSSGVKKIHHFAIENEADGG